MTIGQVAVGLVDPKYPFNVASAIRAAACYGAEKVAWTGTRVRGDAAKLPREERMRGYKKVEQLWIPNHSALTRQLPAHLTPIAVELRDSAESLIDFKHPLNALYLFGPEDGSLGRSHLAACHRFVRIPAMHCLNLGNAVYTVLYDRHAKMVRDGMETELSNAEEVRT